MKLECQSCLLQFDEVGSSASAKCPRCGSSNVTQAATTSSPSFGGASSSQQQAIAPTIAQPMVPPVGGAPSPFSAQPPTTAPQPPAPFGAPPQQSPFGAPPSPYGAPPQQPPQGAFGAPPSPYGAPPQPQGYPQPQPQYGQPPQGAFGAPYAQPQQPQYGQPPMMGYAPSAMQPYGAPPVMGADPARAMTLGIATTLLCCLPMGIASIVTASQGNDALKMGNYELAAAKAKTSMTISYVNMGIVGAIGVLYIIGMIASGA